MAKVRIKYSTIKLRRELMLSIQEHNVADNIVQDMLTLVKNLNTPHKTPRNMPEDVIKLLTKRSEVWTTDEKKIKEESEPHELVTNISGGTGGQDDGEHDDDEAPSSPNTAAILPSVPPEPVVYDNIDVEEDEAARRQDEEGSHNECNEESSQDLNGECLLDDVQETESSSLNISTTTLNDVTSLTAATIDSQDPLDDNVVMQETESSVNISSMTLTDITSLTAATTDSQDLQDNTEVTQETEALSLNAPTKTLADVASISATATTADSENEDVLDSNLVTQETEVLPINATTTTLADVASISATATTADIENEDELLDLSISSTEGENQRPSTSSKEQLEKNNLKRTSCPLSVDQKKKPRRKRRRGVIERRLYPVDKSPCNPQQTLLKCQKFLKAAAVEYQQIKNNHICLNRKVGMWNELLENCYKHFHKLKQVPRQDGQLEESIKKTASEMKNVARYLERQAHKYKEMLDVERKELKSSALGFRRNICCRVCIEPQSF